jgi:O-Antigen ligase
LPQLAVGRLCIILAIVSLCVDLWRRPGAIRFPARSESLLIVGLAGEGAVILLSIATRGHNSAGALYGYLEMASVAIITLVVAQARPRMHLPLLVCAAIGALLGSLDALVFGHSLAALKGESLRLAGHYDNPNLFGFAGSLAVPIFLTLAIRSRRWRAAWLLMGVITLMALCLTYSRGAILGAGMGVIASISLTRSEGRRRLQVGIAGCLLFGALAAVAYPVYEQLRTKADFGSSVEANAPDLSGWDSGAQGLIGSGPSRLSNPDRQALSITATKADEGASIPLGEALVSRHYLLTFLASSPVKGIELAYGLEDNLLGDGPATRAVLLTPVPRRFVVTWTPTRNASHARAYIWLPLGGKVTLSRFGFGRATKARLGLLPTQLLGRVNTFAASESHFVHSREDAAHLAFDLFVQKPLTGIGWQQFTSYSATRLHYGPLASHNEYLRYAAELGLPGLLFLFLIIATVATSAIRIPPTDVRVAAAACVVSGAVGLFFVNALETPNISLPLFVSAALICTGSFAQRTGAPRPTTSRSDTRQ